MADNICNTGTSSGNAFMVARVSSDTGYSAQADYSAFHGGQDYGTAIAYNNGYVYAVSFTTDSALSHSTQCNLIKIDYNTWDTVWTVSENIDSAIQQAPFSVAADDSGNVYMGASVQTPSSFKIAIIKYNAAGSKQWQTDYGTIGFYTLPVAMSLSTHYLNITGFSFTGTGSSQFTTFPVNIHSGTRYPAKTVDGGAGMVSHPVGIATDAGGSSYVAGTATVAGAASVIKMVQYDNAYNQVWATTWGDSTKQNKASAFCLDQPIGGSHLLLTGTAPNGSGGTDLLTQKYGTDGTLLWSRQLSAPVPSHAAAGVTIINDGYGTGNTYVAGTAYNGTDTDIITAAYDTAGALLWMKIYNSGGNDIPFNVNTNGTDVYVTAASYGTDSQYITLDYNQYTKNNTIATTAKGGKYVPRQLIIRFDKSAIDQDAVNNTDIVIADPSYWLTPAADSALQTKVTFDLAGCQMERIYKGLKASYKYSIARNGDSIPIPDLWAAFLLIYPKTDSSDIATANSINTLFPLVVHTGLNYIGELASTCYNPDPHPGSCRINDPFFATQQQQDLWDDSTLTSSYCNPYYNINIDSAWRLETGKPFVKVGIYDTQLDGRHRDFAPNAILSVTTGPNNPGTKAYGWDFINNVSAVAEQWTNAQPHGTATAGMIGAIRNNNGIGVAGIAGGSYTDTTDVGVTLYSMGITNVYGQIHFSYSTTAAVLSGAVAQGSMYVPGTDYGFGLQVTNNSWFIQTDTGGVIATLTPPLSLIDLQELEGAYRNAYKNHTTAVAASGNSQATFGFPANFYNPWVICVGGADEFGNWQNGQGYTSHAGPVVDVIAPSVSGGAGGDYKAAVLAPGNNYDLSFSGTSIATPHVAGTVALLMSYLNSPYSTHQNVSPEDAEHLIERNADNNSTGHTDTTGWGRLNAGRVLQDVNKNCRQLLHRYARPDLITPIYALQRSYTPIKLTEPYTNLNAQTFDTSIYICKVYKSYTTVANTLPANYVIADYWTMGSTTNLLLAYDSTTHILAPYENLYIDSISSSSTTISGYYYKVYNAADTSFIGYWGIDSMYLQGRYPTFGYSILINNPTASCNPSTAIKKIEDEMHISFYPNPVENSGLLKINTDVATNATIDLIDQQGRVIESIYKGQLFNGSNTFDVNTKRLSAGLYMIGINSGEGTKSIKFLKYE